MDSAEREPTDELSRDDVTTRLSHRISTREHDRSRSRSEHDGNSRWARWTAWTNWFITNEVRRRGPTAIARATAIVLASPIIVIATLLPGVGEWISGTPTPVDPIVAAIGSLCFALSPFVLRWTGSPNSAGAWVIISALVTAFVPAYFQQGLGSILMVWFLVSPVVASFFLGGRWSLFVATVAAALMSVFFVLDGLPVAFPAEYYREEASWYRWLNLMLALLVNGALALLWEVSAERAQREQERLEAQVRRSQKLESVGLLAGGVAHDFNNILAGILGHASMLESEIEGPEQRRAQAIVAACRRAAGLVDQMLAYAGRAQTRSGTVELARTIEEVVELLRPALATNTELRLELDRATPPLIADPVQVQQVVMNLITNASEALEGKRGLVVVRTGRLDARVLGRGFLGDEDPARTDAAARAQPTATNFAFVEVRDDGCGIPREKLDEIFDPFFTTKPTGRGLGLAAVLGIVRAHHGDIEIESEPGRGTCFRVLLPCAEIDTPAAVPRRRSSERLMTGAERSAAPSRADAATRAPAPARPHADSSIAAIGSGIPIPRDHASTISGPSATGLLVLVVDDEPAIRELATEVLERAGHRVLLASDGEEGLALFRAHAETIDVVVLDRTMPGLDGLALIERIRPVRPDLPAILSSGYAEHGSTGSLRERGIDEVLHKPWSPRELVAAVARVAPPTQAPEGVEAGHGEPACDRSA